MPKTIKFNLICDNNPVRTLEDLKNNFSIEDILVYFNNGLLLRWLAVRGYDEQFDKVNKVNSKNIVEIICKLIEIFEVEVNLDKVKENTYILEYKLENEVQIEEYKKMDYKTKTIIEDYHSGYNSLIETILSNKEDMAKIKAAIHEMVKNYTNLVDLDNRRLFYIFFSQAPKAIFAMLMLDLFRKLYLPFADGTEELEEVNHDKENIYKKICFLMSKEETLYKILDNDLKTFSGNTEAYWKDVEPKGNNYMILKMENGNFIRKTGAVGGDLAGVDIEGKFIVIDGIDYKSNNAAHKLLYLEV